MVTADMIIDILTLVAVVVFVFVFRRVLMSYFGEKGANLVTRKDIRRIRDDLDEFRDRYDRDIEFLSTELSRKSHTHQARYEHEFQILTEIWDSLIALRRAASHLEPIAEIDDAIISEDQKKARILASFAGAYTDVYDRIEQNRPFYPSAVCEQLLGMIRLLEDEALDDWCRSPDPFEKKFEPEYWEMALDSSDRIITTIDGICQAIRVRISG